MIYKDLHLETIEFSSQEDDYRRSLYNNNVFSSKEKRTTNLLDVDERLKKIIKSINR